jgi:predicted trehalose synthase
VGLIREEDQDLLRRWARFWQGLVKQIFATTYFDLSQSNPRLALAQEDFDLLVDVLLLEKTLSELRYEIVRRPDWIEIPLEGLLDSIAFPWDRRAAVLASQPVE